MLLEQKIRESWEEDSHTRREQIIENTHRNVFFHSLLVYAYNIGGIVISRYGR